MKALPWSYSKLSLWEKCKRKWQYRYIHKIPDAQGPQAKRGSSIHNVAEGFVRGAPGLLANVDGKLGAAWQLLAHKVAQTNIDKFIEILEYFRHEYLVKNLTPEMKVAFDFEFNPIEPPVYKQVLPNHFGTAIFDAALDVDGKLVIFDYKTGRVYPKDHEMQAKIYAYVVYRMTGEIPEVVFIYIDEGGETPYTFVQSDMDYIGNEINRILWDIENMNDFLYPENVTKQCNYCSYKNICRGKDYENNNSIH